MALFKDVVEALIASREWDQATLSRLAYWTHLLGQKELAAITADEVDAALVTLAERGRMKGGKMMTTAAGKPLKGSTINRHVSQLGSVFKHAKRLKLVPRTFISPTLGIERAPERADPDRYLREEEVGKLIAVARVIDRRWGKMAALITLAYHSGARVGNLLQARGKDLDLAMGTLTIPRTKNGDAIVIGLSSAALAELKKLPKVVPEERIFGNRSGGVFTYENLWSRIAKEAGLAGRNFHQLRHGHGHQLARHGVSQQMIMQSMGHKTLSASARYSHASIADKQAVIAKVFG
jgi:integrase